MTTPRIGHGYDVHAFTEGDGIVLGGVEIPCDKAIVAHSDGDVAIHALCDALLGALGRGDIGHLFPDSEDSAQREIATAASSCGKCRIDADTDGYVLLNADLTLIAQTPRIGPHVDAMRQILAGDLDCQVSQINVSRRPRPKSSVLSDRKQGIAAEAVVLLEVNK